MSLLKLEHLNKSFGGLKATADANLHVEPGERVSIIGPNGAGKSTLFNQISGHIRPNSGRIIFAGRDITGMTPYHIVRLGIGRAFQRSNIFPLLTTYENIQAAVTSQHREQYNFWNAVRHMNKINEQVDHILSIIGLHDHRRARVASTLALGDQKRLEIGLALALEPRLLLLDEPTAGMSAHETDSTVQLVNDITQQFNMSLLFTEHDMDVVFGISERIYVLNYGQIIAEGTPQEIAANPQVQEVYLGAGKTQPIE
jgi:branched-chain amino acid transport system ATP-binding protein